MNSSMLSVGRTVWVMTRSSVNGDERNVCLWVRGARVVSFDARTAAITFGQMHLEFWACARLHASKEEAVAEAEAWSASLYAEGCCHVAILEQPS